MEYGLINETIHKVDEHAALQDIADLTDAYHHILQDYFLLKSVEGVDPARS